MNGNRNKSYSRNQTILSTGNSPLDCTKDYLYNGSAIMPGEITKNNIQTDIGSQTTDSAANKKERNYKVRWEKIRQ